jgi:hypothetical protein
MKNLIYIILALIFIQCDNNLDIDMTPVSALAPIYTQIEIGDLVSEEPREYGTLGQIEYYDNYILLTEKETGIHVIDNSNQDSLVNLVFLKLPGITDFIIKDDFLIASLANHLLTIEILDIENTSITSIIEQASPNGIGSYPNMDFSVIFECVDLSKGIVEDWETKLIINPQCEIVK